MATTPVQVDSAARSPPSLSPAGASISPAANSAFSAAASISPATASISSTAALGPLGLWHLLSLDAPSIAVCWMLLFNDGTPAHMQALPSAALALAVWCIYTLDRLMDARAGRELLQERHRFHWRHRRVFVVALGVIALCLAALLPLLPGAVRSAWLLLTLPLLLHAALVHMWHIPQLPKPLVTAAFFATATSLPAAIHSTAPGHLFLSAILFAGVCWLNGVLIQSWEDPPRMEVQTTGTLAAMAGCLLAVASCLWVLQRSPAVLACAGSVLLLLLLHHRRDRMQALALRSMADAALLTPLLIMLAVR